MEKSKSQLRHFPSSTPKAAVPGTETERTHFAPARWFGVGQLGICIIHSGAACLRNQINSKRAVANITAEAIGAKSVPIASSGVLE